MIQICLPFQVNISKKYFLESKEKLNKTVFKSHECCFAEHNFLMVCTASGGVEFI